LSKHLSSNKALLGTNLRYASVCPRARRYRENFRDVVTYVALNYVKREPLRRYFLLCV
jgi:hypothetical protein